jgi:hypothetical protein
MKFPRVKWLTIDDCAQELANEPGSLPKDKIKQELLRGLLEGAIPFRLKRPPDGPGPVEDWTPDDFKVAAIGTGGNSHGFAELRIAGDDPKAIAKLAAVRWQDYSQHFQKAYLERIELLRKSARAFARAEKNAPRTTSPEDCSSRTLRDSALLRELRAKYPVETERPSDREMARQLATGTRKAESIRKRIAEWRKLGKLGNVTQ